VGGDDFCFWGVDAVSNGRSISALTVFGLVLMVLGFLVAFFFAFVGSAYSIDSYLLFSLKTMVLGIALELLGLGLVIAGRT
jgi:hypothetical protein